MPDTRKSTIAQEDFMNKVDVVLKNKGMTISDEEHRYLLDLFIHHKDKEIESCLRSL